MKYIFIAISALALTACGQVDRMTSAVTGSSTSCVKGLSVVQMTSGAFYERTADDKLVSCK